MTPVRIGLAGYGRGGRFFHAPLIGLAPECTLAGVLTRSPQRRAELAGDFPGLPVAGRLTELAAAGIDAVVISTPLDTHEALVREAIALGLPVVCDKPFTPDGASARALVDEAERSGVPLTVYQNRRWDADFRTVRELVESGTLGEVTGFESRMEQYPPPGGFSATGGGVLRDFGSHVVDQALHLFGPAAAVYAEVHVRPEDGFDDRFFLSVRHAGGVASHLRGDWTLHGAPGPRFRVTGRTGTFAVESDDGQSERLLSGEAAEPGPFGTLPFGTVPGGPLGADLPRRECPARARPGSAGPLEQFLLRLRPRRARRGRAAGGPAGRRGRARGPGRRPPQRRPRRGGAAQPSGLTSTSAAGASGRPAPGPPCASPTRGRRAAPPRPPAARSASRVPRAARPGSGRAGPGRCPAAATTRAPAGRRRRRSSPGARR